MIINMYLVIFLPYLFYFELLLIFAK